MLPLYELGGAQQSSKCGILAAFLRTKISLGAPSLTVCRSLAASQVQADLGGRRFSSLLSSWPPVALSDEFGLLNSAVSAYLRGTLSLRRRTGNWGRAPTTLAVKSSPLCDRQDPEDPFSVELAAVQRQCELPGELARRARLAI